MSQRAVEGCVGGAGFFVGEESAADDAAVADDDGDRHVFGAQSVRRRGHHLASGVTSLPVARSICDPFQQGPARMAVWLGRASRSVKTTGFAR
jgi:hypothetical protein